LYEKSRDDLISSGITMDKVVRKLQLKFKKAKIHPVVFDDENSDGVAFIRPHPKQWIVFPYE
jgi:orotate phosphoribosyltransferase-like protein